MRRYRQNRQDYDPLQRIPHMSLWDAEDLDADVALKIHDISEALKKGQKIVFNLALKLDTQNKFYVPPRLSDDFIVNVRSASEYIALRSGLFAVHGPKIMDRVSIRYGTRVISDHDFYIYKDRQRAADLYTQLVTKVDKSEQVRDNNGRSVNMSVPRFLFFKLSQAEQYKDAGQQTNRIKGYAANLTSNGPAPKILLHELFLARSLQSEQIMARDPAGVCVIGRPWAAPQAARRLNEHFSDCARAGRPQKHYYPLVTNIVDAAQISQAHLDYALNMPGMAPEAHVKERIIEDDGDYREASMTIGGENQLPPDGFDSLYL